MQEPLRTFEIETTAGFLLEFIPDFRVVSVMRMLCAVCQVPLPFLLDPSEAVTDAGVLLPHLLFLATLPFLEFCEARFFQFS